jgi:hypothetical protein
MSNPFEDLKASTILPVLSGAGDDANREQRFVVVLAVPPEPFNADTHDLRVAPISFEAHHAAEHDLVCTSEEGPWERAFIVEVWNSRPMLWDSTTAPVGEIPRDTYNRLVDLHNSMFDGHAVDPTWHGPEIESDDDPRIAFQKREFEAFEPFSNFVDDLLGPAERGRSEADEHVSTAASAYIFANDFHVRHTFLAHWSKMVDWDARSSVQSPGSPNLLTAHDGYRAAIDTLKDWRSRVEWVRAFPIHGGFFALTNAPYMIHPDSELRPAVPMNLPRITYSEHVLPQAAEDAA